MINYKVIEINNENIFSLEPLNIEALADGICIVKKTINEWRTGENTFSKTGEKFWGLFIGSECIAIGGLQIDPYVENNDGTVGRVRHLYVAKKNRGNGLSRVIMNLVLDEAKKNFKILRLSTKNPIAASLYESLGFVKKEGVKVTHIIDDLERSEYNYMLN
jgi:GNAT superfamily N-acetyltransferase